MTKVIAINISSNPRVLGGAAIAAKFHSLFISNFHNEIELWRMWYENNTQKEDGLIIRNFKSKSFLDRFNKLLPKRLIRLFINSEISNEIIKQKPDIVHIHNVLPSFEFLRIISKCKKNCIKVVVSTHGFYEIFNPNLKLNFIEKILWKILVAYPIKLSLRYIDKFISSYPQEKILLNNLNIDNSKIEFIENGINPFYEKKSSQKENSKVIKKFNIDIHNPILFFTGNHFANKGIDIVIKIAKKIKIKSTIIIGGKKLFKQEENYFLDKFNSKYAKVIFTDYLSEEDQRALYNISTLLLFPSKSDTSPLTILEAMACGLPVIAFNVGGIGYLLENESGFAIDNISFSDFYNCVIKNLKNKAKLESISKNGLNRQRTIFNWTKAAKKTVAIYDNLIKENIILND